MEFVGERWALLIMRELLLGPRRFGELRAGLPGLSANVLTQRLASVERSGIVRRCKLPSPANVQVYELTPWGRESEPVILALARWALRSPTHDPSLPFSAVSLLLSLRMLLMAERAGEWTATVGFRIGEETFTARLEAGALAVARAPVEGAEAVLSGTPSAFLPVIYGGMPLAAAEAAGMLAIEGNRSVAERFVTLFALPDKVAVE
jgi:DNA-binding HxlR family transcriptional regulator/putative sterol carrier protein